MRSLNVQFLHAFKCTLVSMIDKAAFTYVDVTAALADFRTRSRFCFAVKPIISNGMNIYCYFG